MLPVLNKCAMVLVAGWFINPCYIQSMQPVNEPELIHGCRVQFSKPITPFEFAWQLDVYGLNCEDVMMQILAGKKIIKESGLCFNSEYKQVPCK